MKKLFFAVLIFSTISLWGSMTGKQFGVGLGGGTGTSGITGKYYLSEPMAIQAQLGSQQGYGFALGVDVVFELPPVLYKNGDIKTPWYVGGGVALWSYDSYSAIFFSGVVGLAFQFQKIPLEIAIEWRPLLYLGDGYLTGLYLGGGGGAIRWYF